MRSEHPVKVYYEDTDCLGVVYHTNYLKYFERARTEMFEAHMGPLAELNRRGEVFVVAKIECTFRAAARFGDALVIETEVVIASAYRAVFKQKALRLPDREPLVVGDVDVVCVDTNGKLRELPESLRALSRP